MELAQQPGGLTHPAQGALAVIGDCHVLGGSGVVFFAGETLSLIFRDDELLVRSVGGREQRIAYDAISALEIGGPGVQRSGGGFYGGGFGLSDAVEGMLVASALNMLTTRTKVTTVICVQTADAELFVRHTTLTPDGLRIHLSAVFVTLRGRPHQTSGLPQQAAEPQADDVISKLATLSGLLDRGLIDRTEFDRLKGQTLGESSAGKP
jgi:hypothetical protein